MAVAVASAAVWRPREPARGLARDALRQCLPAELKDAGFVSNLKADPAAWRWLTQLQRTVFDVQPL